jgi:hypothetical protein
MIYEQASCREAFEGRSDKVYLVQKRSVQVSYNTNDISI